MANKSRWWYFQVYNHKDHTTTKYPVKGRDIDAARNDLFAVFLKDSDGLDIDIQKIQSVSKTYFFRLQKELGFSRAKIYKPVLELDIIKAHNHTKSNKEAARYMGLSWKKYMRWAKRYVDEDGVSLYEKHKRSSSSILQKEARQKPLSEIFAGQHPDYNTKHLRMRLISEGIKENECEVCNYCTPRLSDKQVPLILHWTNGDKKDHSLENLQLLCFNCSFVYDEKVDYQTVKRQYRRSKAKKIKDDGNWGDDLSADIYERLRQL